MVREPRPGETGDRLSEPLGSRAEAEGLVMRRPSLTPFTMPSLEATEYAREVGMDEVFFGQTMKAYWEEGADLGNMFVLESIAESSGLDWEVLQPRLESGHYREQVLSQHREAVSLGIRGIPAFLIGNLCSPAPSPTRSSKGSSIACWPKQPDGKPSGTDVQLKTQTSAAPSIPISAPSTICPTKAGSKSLRPSSPTSDGQVPSFSSTASTSPLPIGKTVDPFSLAGTPRSQ